MLQEKEELFQQYYKTTFLAVSSSDPEEIVTFVNKREELIEKIQEINATGTTEFNEKTKQIIHNILVLEADLISKMEKLKQDAQEQISSLNGAKKLRSQYEQMYTMTDGAFYDKRG
ncbi:hypothetical protein BEP19_07555 [Ammoniphilus oxalaticus]|uniref:Flagellar protein FliT n=1 Tax=Ammoniphilus oxalaticus TaxID=66863 RepID=A0A419SJP0_9BACL|nr:flagellar protein FliT [Ammoniphilus oxalaticus]RKD24251.1 hypothetical protein BEP19_07555 [Ammoniphilus oxalaticus]